MTKVKMIELHIPGRGDIQLKYAVFDVNGTLATDGQLIAGIEPLIAQLRDRVEVRLLTADTHGKQIEIDRLLNLTADRLQPGGHEREQKADYVRALGAAARGRHRQRRKRCGHAEGRRTGHRRHRARGRGV